MEAERELGGRWDLQTGASTTFRMYGGGIFIQDLQMPFERLCLGAGVSHGASLLFLNGQPRDPWGTGRWVTDAKTVIGDGAGSTFRDHFGVVCPGSRRCPSQPQLHSESLAL